MDQMRLKEDMDKELVPRHGKCTHNYTRNELTSDKEDLSFLFSVRSQVLYSWPLALTNWHPVVAEVNMVFSFPLTSCVPALAFDNTDVGS